MTYMVAINADLNVISKDLTQVSEEIQDTPAPDSIQPTLSSATRSAKPAARRDLR